MMADSSAASTQISQALQEQDLAAAEISNSVVSLHDFLVDKSSETQHISTQAETLSNSTESIFVHLSGNHTDYCNRYPAEYKKYEVSAMDSLWMHLFKGGPGRSKECYDNSIIYNDFVVSSIIKKLKVVLAEEKVGGLIYFADHADDVTRGGHSSANFSYDMIESPMMTWFSPAYRGQRPLETATYMSNMDKYYPNDFIFDTVIGMTKTDVSQNVYCSTCDLFNSEYVLRAIAPKLTRNAA